MMEYVVTGNYPLTETEKEAILWMREEEKLARDVYLTLYEQWGQRIFLNIARSEEEHMAAVKRLIDVYGLEDPVINEVGKFSNPELQQLYDQLVAQGSQSLVDALKVGALIEELDIWDLENWLQKVENPDVRSVFCFLERGSRNHLRAFTSVLSNYGETYTPQYISYEEYQQIINSPWETGPTVTGC
ncbi:MAG: DUF2202 domain-containing protein [Candidatus Diapherotrites archaeon]|nr:DUF2202 domain-containing protein [Candidatus Diapherotrites archaeon]